MEGRIHLLGTGTVVLEEQLCFTSDTVGAVVARTPCDNPPHTHTLVPCIVQSNIQTFPSLYIIKLQLKEKLLLFYVEMIYY